MISRTASSIFTAALFVVLAGCEVSVVSGGDGGSPSTSSSSSSSGGSCGVEVPLQGACMPGPACLAAGSVCLAHVDQQASPTPGFRMSQLTFDQPNAFSLNVVADVLQTGAWPADLACHLSGNGGISWLLRFDLVAGTLTTGGSLPAAAPAGPYSFVDAVTTSGPLDAACVFDAGPIDLLLPIFLPVEPPEPLVLPFRGLTLHGQLSPRRDCIGRYNADTLDPGLDCKIDGTHPAFRDGGSFEAYFHLEDADLVPVPMLSMSLCVLLAPDTQAYGASGPQGLTVCKRDSSGKILFQGDWCSGTSAPASGGCADAVRVRGRFAAQAVQIL